MPSPEAVSGLAELFRMLAGDINPNIDRTHFGRDRAICITLLGLVVAGLIAAFTVEFVIFFPTVFLAACSGAVMRKYRKAA